MIVDEVIFANETEETVASEVEVRKSAVVTLCELLKMHRKIQVLALFVRSDCPIMKIMLDNS